MWTESSGHFDTHHVRHHILYVPRSEKSHSPQDLSKFTSHTPFLFTSHLHPACLYEPASHRHAAQSCRPPLSPSPSQTEWEKFTLAFSFFFLGVLWGSCYGDGTQRQLWQPMYTWVGRALSLWVWVWLCVCVSCMMPKDEVQGRFATDQLVVMCVLLPVEQRVLFTLFCWGS